MIPPETIEVAFELTPADAAEFARFWPTHDAVFLRQMRSSRVTVTVLFDSMGARDGLLASPTLLGLAASFENLADLLAPAAELGVAEEDA